MELAKHLLILGGLLIMCSCSNQKEEVKVNPYQADFLEVYEIIQKNHSNPYTYVEKEDLDLHFNQIYNEISDDTSLIDFNNLINKFLSKIGDGHMSSSIPNDILFALISNKLIIPFNLFMKDDSYYLESFEDTVSFEVLKIQGIDIEVVMENVYSIMIVEGDDELIKRSKIQLPYQFALYYSQLFSDESLTVKIETTDSVIQVNQITTFQFFDQLTKEYGNKKLSYDIKEKYGSILIPDFNHYDEESFTNYKLVLSNFFRDIKKSEVSDIIIDIRNNTGGNPYSVVELLKYILENDFVYFTNNTDGYADLKKEIKPYNNYNDYSYYIVYNSGSFSSAAQFISYVKDITNVTLIGSISNGGSSCFGNLEEIHLKNSGVSLKYTTGKYVVKSSNLLPYVEPSIYYEGDLSRIFNGYADGESK